MVFDNRKGVISLSFFLNIILQAILLVFIFNVYTASGQGSVRHQSPTVIERGQTMNLQFDLPNLNSDEIQEARFFYSYNGSMGYEQIELSPTGPMTSTYEAELPIDESGANRLSYYARFNLTDGRTITYPASQADVEPVTVNIVESRDQEEEKTAKIDTVTGKYGKIEYTILSPEPGTSMNLNDALIAITFFYQDTPIPADSLRIELNGKDITTQAEVDSYFISYVPEDLDKGKHEVEINYKNRPNNSKKTIANWNFKASEEAATISASPTQTDQSRWPELPFQGRVELSTRNQVIGGNTDNATRGNLRLSGKQGDLSYSLNGRLTTQQDPRRQTQNRLGGEIRYSNWFELRAGHIYPNISNYSISGRRMMGVNSEIKLLNKNINLELIYGRLDRNIDNLYNPIQSQYDTLASFQNNAVVDTSFTLDFQNNGRGTHKRNIRGGRIAFGNRNFMQLGFHAMQIRDDTTSITNLNGFNDIDNHNPSLLNELDTPERDTLEANPALLNVSASNPQPKDNFVTGTDFLMNLDQNRIRIEAEASASLVNEDISGGYLDSTRANDLGVDLDSNIENYLSTYEWLFIVNENMSVLPFKFEQQNDGTSELSPFVPQSIFAGEGQISLNYYNNNLKVRYRWIGPEYNSLANTTHRKDLAGFTISDRIRMFDNRIYLTLGYENLRNNLVGNRDATTNTNSYRTNISWYPVKQSLPRVSIGWRYRIRDNDIQRRNPYLDDNLNSAIRNVASDSTTVLPDPRSKNNTLIHGSISQQFDLWNITHDASLNMSYQKTDDEVFKYGNTESFTYSLNLNSRFNDLPLNTSLGTSLNQTETQGGLNDISIFGVNFGGTYFLLDDRLELHSNITLTRNINESTPITVDQNQEMDENLNLGPSQRLLNDIYVPNEDEQTERKSMSYVLRGTAQYNLNKHHSFMIDINYNNVVSLRRNYTIPNDRIIQARYIFNF